MVGGQLEALDAVEEPELDPARGEHPVEWGEDRVAHPRLHLVDDRPLVVARAHEGVEDRARPERRRGEDRVVEALHDGRMAGLVRGAVVGEPGAEILPVDAEPVLSWHDHAVDDEPARDGEGKIDDDPEAAQPVGKRGLRPSPALELV